MATADDIKSFRDWRQGMAIAVCVDVSGTMSRGPLDEVKAALSALFKKVRPNDRFALISFADERSSFGEPEGHLTAVGNLRTRGKKHGFIKQSIPHWICLKILHFKAAAYHSHFRWEGRGSIGIAPEAINKARPECSHRYRGVGRIEEQYAEALRGLTALGDILSLPVVTALAPTAALAKIYENLLRSVVVNFHYVAEA